MFPVVTVADAAAWLTEPLGSKRKFWFQHESSIPLSRISLKRLGRLLVRIGLKKLPVNCVACLAYRMCTMI